MNMPDAQRPSLGRPRPRSSVGGRIALVFAALVVGARVLVVAEYDPVVWDDPAFAATQRKMTGALLACAQQQGLATLDSYEAMAAISRPRQLYVLWHMSHDGNALIARLVAAALGLKAS